MRLTPDGVRYLSMARGERQPMPFHLRWALPWMCGERAWAWIAATVLGLVLLLGGTAQLALTHGATAGQAALAAALVAGLPSVRFALRYPVLVDLPAVGLPVCSAALWESHPPVAIALLGIGAAISEKSPVWAAVFAWTPEPLLALALPVIRRLVSTPGEVSPTDPHAETLLYPVRTGLASHRGGWLSPRRMLAPWGVCLVAVASPPGVPLLAALAVGYSQLLVATDTVRLYQQAAPLAAISAAMLLPVEWAIPIVAVHWFNPWRGNGV